MTANMIRQRTGNKLPYDAKHLYQLLHDGLRLHTIPDDTSQLETWLTKIAEKAVEVDRLMTQHTTQFSIFFHHPDTGQARGFAFNKSKTMELDLGAFGGIRSESSHSLVEGWPVDFIVAPGLYHRGKNASDGSGIGTRFDKAEVVVPMRVALTYDLSRVLPDLSTDSDDNEDDDDDEDNGVGKVDETVGK